MNPTDYVEPGTPTAAEVLHPILATGHPGRWRIFEGVCVNGHRVLEVFATGEGLVVRFRMGRAAASWRATAMANHPATGSRGWRRRRRDRGDQVVTYLKHLLLEQPGPDEPGLDDAVLHVVPVWCRCTPNNMVNLTEVVDHLRNGTRRAVLTSY